MTAREIQGHGLSQGDAGKGLLGTLGKYFVIINGKFVMEPFLFSPSLCFKSECDIWIIAVILWSWCNMHRGETKNCRDSASEPMIATAMSRLLHLGPYLQPFLMDRAIQQSNTNLTRLCIQSFLFPGWIVPNTKFFKLMIFINKQILYI